MTNKPTIRLVNWWIHGAHVSGKDLDNGKKYVRSARVKELESMKEGEDDYREGDVISTHAVDYKLVGHRRRKFTED